MSHPCDYVLFASLKSRPFKLMKAMVDWKNGKLYFKKKFLKNPKKGCVHVTHANRFGVKKKVENIG